MTVEGKDQYGVVGKPVVEQEDQTQAQEPVPTNQDLLKPEASGPETKFQGQRPLPLYGACTRVHEILSGGLNLEP